MFRNKQAAEKAWRKSKLNRRFCLGGRRFAKGKTLAFAWRSCQNPGYMRYWLVACAGVETLGDLGYMMFAKRANESNVGHRKRWAEALRARYDYTGRVIS